MKAAVGIAALCFSMIASLQSCAVTGRSGMVGERATQQAGGLGMLVAIAMLFGGAFSVLLVMRILFAASFALFFLAEGFSDMQIWGWLSVGLALLLTSLGSKKGAGTGRTGV